MAPGDGVDSGAGFRLSLRFSLQLTTLPQDGVNSQ
jgi:hypothetical protein